MLRRAFRGVASTARPPVSQERAARSRAQPRVKNIKESDSVLDLMFIAIVLAFYGLSFGYAAFCDRL